jgi:creatinine amidohydrolase
MKTTLPMTLLPHGSWEDRGDNLPFDTATRVASALAKVIYDLLSRPAGRPLIMNAEVRLLPPIAFSCSHEWRRSLSLRPATLLSLFDELANESPGGLFVVVNGNIQHRLLDHWAAQGNRARPRLLHVPRRDTWMSACAAAGIETPWGDDVHGGEIERSLMLHLHPDLVGEKPQKDVQVKPDQRRWWGVTEMTEHAPQGVLGYPSRANAEKGRKLLAALAEESVKDIAAMSMRLWQAGDRRKAQQPYPPAR